MHVEGVGPGCVDDVHHDQDQGYLGCSKPQVFGAQEQKGFGEARQGSNAAKAIIHQKRRSRRARLARLIGNCALATGRVVSSSSTPNATRSTHVTAGSTATQNTRLKSPWLTAIRAMAASGPANAHRIHRLAQTVGGAALRLGRDVGDWASCGAPPCHTR